MTRKAVIGLFALAAMTIAGFGIGTFGNTNHRATELMADDCTVAFLPSRDRGHLVDVYAVNSEGTENAVVKRIGLSNLSGQNVAAVKLGWRVHKEGASSIVLLEGQSRLLRVPLTAGKRLLVSYPLVSYGEVMKPLQENGSLHGDLRLEVSVTQIIFEDGTQTTGDASSIQDSDLSSRVQRVSLRSRAMLIQDDVTPTAEDTTVAAPPPCNNSLCAFVPRLNKWVCTSATGYHCVVNAAANSCTDSVCPPPPPPGPVVTANPN